MSVIYIVLPLALLVAAAAVVVFVRAVRAGQFDDLHTPALRILHDDDASGDRAYENRVSARATARLIRDRIAP